MKALSIKQPWAWLIVNGYKDIENRSWKTKVRGPILIHASKSVDMTGFAYVALKYPDVPMPPLNSLPTGGIVGSAEIVDCITESESRWWEGPHGLVLTNAKPLPFRPFSGALYFFEVPE